MCGAGNPGLIWWVIPEYSKYSSSSDSKYSPVSSFMMLDCDEKCCSVGNSYAGVNSRPLDKEAVARPKIATAWKKRFNICRYCLRFSRTFTIKTLSSNDYVSTGVRRFQTTPNHFYRKSIIKFSYLHDVSLLFLWLDLY